jgi:succinyl-diaminopimelate desuccinylase
LVEAGAGEIQPKQAWTNVADFTAHGIDAVNFGPGHTRYAHRRDEQVEISALVHAYETLERLVRGSIGEDGA